MAWVAISKNVENQMLEKSINRVPFEWTNPDMDFVDVYPQGDSAFAVKVVGYDVLMAVK